MKKSEELKQQAQQEENDYKAFSLHNKSLRERRMERAESEYLPLLKAKFEVYERPYMFTIDTGVLFDIIDFYPKKNKVLIRKNNEWKDQGLQWIKDNLLK